MAKASDNVFPKIIVSAGTAPATPAAGQGKVYEKSSDKKLYFMNDAGTEYDLTASGGGGTFVGCGAERTTNQSVASGAWTAVQLNATDLYDTDSIHDPATNSTRFTIPTGKGGKWRFTSTAELASNSTGIRAIGWAKNGTLLANRYGQNYRTALTGGAGSVMNTTVDLDLAAGDYIESSVYHDSGVSLNITSAYVTCQYLG